MGLHRPRFDGCLANLNLKSQVQDPASFSRVVPAVLQYHVHASWAGCTSHILTTLCQRSTFAGCLALKGFMSSTFSQFRAGGVKYNVGFPQSYDVSCADV